MIQPAPLPTEMTVSQISIDGKKVSVLQITTPQGMSVFFLDETSSKAVGTKLLEFGTGILLKP